MRFFLFFSTFLLSSYTVRGLRLTLPSDPAQVEILYEGNVLSEDEVKARLQDLTVAFMLPLGPKRNSNLPHVRANIEKIGKLFRDFIVVISTPGSDGVAAATEWQTEAQSEHSPIKYNVLITTEETKLDKGGCNPKSKPCRIAPGRDAIVNTIREQEKKYDYSIAVDSDMVKQWNARSFLKAFSLDDEKWAAIAANGIGLFVPGGHSDWLGFESQTNYPKHHAFDPDASAFEVIHAYGGVAIYRTEPLLQCKHVPGTGCDNFHLQACLRENGHKIYFHPGFIIEWKKKGEKAKVAEASWSGDPPEYWKH